MPPVTALFPGTFDPVTLGHIDLIMRASRLFEHIVVGIAENKAKQPTFSLTERIAFVEQATAHVPNISVRSFSGLLVDFLSTCNARVIIRGLRAVSDFEYELQLANMNSQLAPDIDTLFLTPSAQYAFLSSSIVREVASLGGTVTAFVPEPVEKALVQLRQQRGRL